MNANPAPGAMQLLVERQASQLAVLRRRLEEAHRALGQVQKVVEAEPLRELRQRPYAALPARPVVHPGHAEHWPTLPPLVLPLQVRSGHQLQTAGAAGLPVIAVGVCGLTHDEAASVLEEVMTAQRRERGFAPLFLTDRAQNLALFRRQGYAVELLPDDDALARCPEAGGGDGARRARLAAIARAWAIERFVDRGRIELPWPCGTRPRQAVPLFFYKDYRRYNPYQHLLYAALPGFAARPGTVEAALEWMAAGGTPPVFHLNWEEAVYREARSRTEAATRAAAFVAALRQLRAAGGTILWTLHNKAPHDNAFPAVHARLVRRIGAAADLVHVHSRHMRDWAVATIGVEPERVVVAPHGNYRGVLAASVPSPERARLKLRLPAGGRLVGMVGTIRHYKGADGLLAAFASLRTDKLRLLLAGQQAPPLPTALLAAAGERLIVHDRHLDHDEVTTYAAACDAIVLPYREAGTSGAALLAFSLGRPVIVPDLPVFRELVEEGRNGLLYAAGSERALAAALRRFAAFDDAALRDLSRAASATARLHDWGWIGRRLAVALETAMAADRPVATAARRPARRQQPDSQRQCENR